VDGEDGHNPVCHRLLKPHIHPFYNTFVQDKAQWMTPAGCSKKGHQAATKNVLPKTPEHENKEKNSVKLVHCVMVEPHQ